MRSTTWEYLVGAIFLVACLIGGLTLSREFSPKPVIGVLRFEGVIDFNTAEYLIEVLDAARRDENVAGIVMEILSPGGFATSSESIYYSMLQARESKPLVVYIDGLAASGGYYMAVASNRIYVPPSARVGNIGARTIQPTDPSLAPRKSLALAPSNSAAAAGLILSASSIWSPTPSPAALFISAPTPQTIH